MLKTVVSAIIIAFLVLLFAYKLAKPYFQLHPWIRNRSLFEGFDTSGNDTSGNDTSGNSIDNTSVLPPVAIPPVGETNGSREEDDDPTQKSTQLADMFEKVNTQMDILRTIKLSDTYLPLSLDKTAEDPFVILANLKLLINNGIYKNELDIKELNDKYIGNKAVQLLASDINSINMEPGATASGVYGQESSFLKRAQTIVDAHQKLIDKILEAQSRE